MVAQEALTLQVWVRFDSGTTILPYGVMVNTLLSKSGFLSSNLSGATLNKYDMNVENPIKELLEANIEELDKLYKFLELVNLLNEQYVLDWLDRLNEISVR